MRFESPGFWLWSGIVVLVLMMAGYFFLMRTRDVHVLPPLAQGIDLGEASEVPNPQWTAQLIARFPMGSNLGAMTDELSREGFTVDAAKRRASYHYGGGFPCLEILEVDWKADARARLRALEGYHYQVCVRGSRGILHMLPRRR